MKQPIKQAEIVFGKETFITRNPGKFNDYYEIIKELGTGGFGKVYRVKHKSSNEFRACKQLFKGKISDIDCFNMEIDILSKMDHPNIIKLYEIFEDDKNLFLVMEECLGGELFDRILENVDNNTMYTEKEAATIFKQFMSAIAYCHAQKICHRDFKAENVLFVTKERDSQIKLIDFGFSKVYSTKKGKSNMKTQVGTPYYVSPEVLKGEYNEKCDIWSAGVTLYLMLGGEPPFNGNTDVEIYKAIEKKTFTFPETYWKNISTAAKDLITKMLAEPETRYTAIKVLEHPWITKSTTSSSTSLTSINLDNLKDYSKSHKLKRAVITFIASRINECEVSNLKEIFENLDTNKDGTLSLEEIKTGISKLKTKGAKMNVEEIFKSIDSNQKGQIHYTEFIASVMDPSIYLKEERLHEAFEMFDLDKSGKISKEEIKKALNIQDNTSEKTVEKMMKELDLNGDGEIDYNEFITMMKVKVK